MLETETPRGSLFVWSWGDREIEDLQILKAQLNAIDRKNFTGIIVSLDRTRYELTEPKVIRAISQSSQWAANCKLSFWIQADPRRSSRSLVNDTGERTQALLLLKTPTLVLNHKNLNIGKVKNNRFELRYYYPQFESFPLIQDRALHFSPIRLERAFLFQMKENTILNDTIVDITSNSHFCPNISKGYVDVFGEIKLPKNETWWVLAFPLFDTNLYDYAGRESNDIFNQTVETLFDTGAYLNGILWDKISYHGDIGRLSVSISIYNSFRAEYEYDLRDVLYGLVFDSNDQSHIRIRNDYYSLLQDLALSAQKDYYQMAHSFFGDLHVATRHSFYWHNHHTRPCCYSNPWQGLDQVNIGFSQLEKTKKGKDRMSLALAMLTITKSLGVFSKNKMAFASLPDSLFSVSEMKYFQELMFLYSIRWVYTHPFAEKKAFRPDEMPVSFSNQSIWKAIGQINKKSLEIDKITGYQFPESNVLFVYPAETITSLHCDEAESRFYTVHRLIGDLIARGIQLDVVSASLLKKCRLSSNHLHIGNRNYEAMIYPYPEVLDPKALEILSLLDKVKFPLFLGGSHPKWTTKGKRIPHTFPIKFDPADKDLSRLLEAGIRPLFQMPENALGTLIQNTKELLFLLHPAKPGSSFKGKIQYKEIDFEVPKSSGLTIFRKRKNKPVERMM